MVSLSCKETHGYSQWTVQEFIIDEKNTIKSISRVIQIKGYKKPKACKSKYLRYLVNLINSVYITN